MDNRDSGFQIRVLTFHRKTFVFVKVRPSFLADRFLRVWLGVTRLSQLDLAELFNLLDTPGLSSSLIEEFATVPATVSTNPARMIHDAQPRRAAVHADAIAAARD
ncbi:hypothetical protein [Rhodococcus sp. B7740]|uniref:hypothetical protein n=1 Tax=Rhodococcus sp. B7740 TaxID=1564114 RepID=UPI0005EBE817|nr:hypothetical protein [Rhodococcus sp. B7740]